MALVDGHVDRLTDGAARVVQPRRDKAKLDEVLKVLEGAVTTAGIKIRDERRPVGGRKYRVISTDLDVASRVARVLSKYARRGAAHDVAGKPGRNVDPAAIGHLGAGFSPESDRLIVAADLEPDLFEQEIGVSFDGIKPVGRQELVRRNLAGDVGRGHRARGPRLVPGLAPTRTDTAAGSIVFWHCVGFRRAFALPWDQPGAQRGPGMNDGRRQSSPRVMYRAWPSSSKHSPSRGSCHRYDRKRLR